MPYHWYDASQREKLQEAGISAGASIPVLSSPPDPSGAKVYVDVSGPTPTLQGWNGTSWVVLSVQVINL